MSIMITASVAVIGPVSAKIANPQANIAKGAASRQLSAVTR
jgi:hypothetical protein